MSAAYRIHTNHLLPRDPNHQNLKLEAHNTAVRSRSAGGHGTPKPHNRLSCLLRELYDM
jgi:hypothetical protein